MYGKAMNDQFSDQVAFLRLVLRVPLLPVWLPIVLWRRHKRNKDMAAFAKQRLREGNRKPDEIALKWVVERPKEYILGEYDPAINKLTKTFSKILARRE
jgi:hypothetical protein